MPYNKETFLKAENILLNKRNSNARTLDERKAKIYIEYPRIKDIEQELCKTAMNVGRAILNGKKAPELLNNLKSENLALQQELKDILISASLPTDYLDDIYDCSPCKDTGFIDGKMCSCFKNLLKTITYQELNSLSPLSLSSFDSFSLDYYDNAPINGGESSKEKMTKIFNYCKQYCEKFSLNSPSILMQGGTGLGKTHLALSIANDVINAGYGVIYFSAPNILQQLEKEHFSKNTDEETLKQITTCDLLILDDLGTEFATNFSNTTIYNIFNYRLSTNKPIIISTNLNYTELEKQYSQRFISRLIGNCVKMNFVGKDIRFIKRSI